MSIELADIRAAAARIKGRVLRTPVRRSEWLSGVSGADVHLKLEVVQPTSSFKIRGAFNAALRVHEDAAAGKPPRLVTASAGNHGRGLAQAARILDLPLTVFIAADAPRAKVDAIRAAGAELRECADYDEAERQAKAYAAGGGGLRISPYSHPDVIAGAGTIALELLEDLPSIDMVVVPVGGGGLIGGVAIAVKALSPSTRVIGVEVAASCPFTRSLAAGRLVTIEVGPSLADGLTGNLDPRPSPRHRPRGRRRGRRGRRAAAAATPRRPRHARASGHRGGGSRGPGRGARGAHRRAGDRRGDPDRRKYRSRSPDRRSALDHQISKSPDFQITW